jgi:heat shock protein HslJ
MISGQLVTRTWKLAPKGLTLESIRSPGRLDLEIISEDEWELERWDMHESVGKGPTVTLTFQDGRFVGSAGCNRYFAPITVGQIPGDITIGPIGGTRMACADTAMMVETRFLQQLAGVTRVGFLNTRLTLTVPRDSVSSTTMLFRRKGKNE